MKRKKYYCKSCGKAVSHRRRYCKRCYRGHRDSNYTEPSQLHFVDDSQCQYAVSAAIAEVKEGPNVFGEWPLMN